MGNPNTTKYSLGNPLDSGEKYNLFSQRNVNLQLDNYAENDSNSTRNIDLHEGLLVTSSTLTRKVQHLGIDRFDKDKVHFLHDGEDKVIETRLPSKDPDTK